MAVPLQTLHDVTIHEVKKGEIYVTFAHGGGWMKVEEFLSQLIAEQTKKLKAEIRTQLVIIAPYGSHKWECASNTEQTSEFCDCGLDKARAAYNKIDVLTR